MGFEMQKLLGLIAFFVFSNLNSFAHADSYFEPKRGTTLRSSLMDAIRPHIEWELGQPIEFIVNELRASGNYALAFLSPQKPGGIKIDISKTPGFKRGSLDPNYMDGTAVVVLYEKKRETWVAVHHSIGATDVWFSEPELCSQYQPVIPEFC
tara:strand:+ start:294 stop:749 length:456 start_codon:yes stop_codon:yes gene_type:complete